MLQSCESSSHDIMKKSIIPILLCLIPALGLHAELTIEECVSKAEAHYPSVRKYDLLATTKDIDLSDINRSWLPRIAAYGQLTGQNVVPSFPESLTGVLEQMGQPMKGLGKVQYKIGVDISQSIWDGGAAAAGRNLVRSQDDMRRAALDVELYAVRQRVENIYFALLLIEEQIAQNDVTYSLLMNNLEKVRSMKKNGVAMQSDLDMVEAQALGIKQIIALAQSAAQGYRLVLELFIGESIDGEKLVRPNGELPLNRESNRPELRLFESQLVVNEATKKLSDTSLMPKIGLFAQAYYGYPGFDYFKSMINRDLSFNIMAGLKVSWNIDAFYIRKNTSRRSTVNAGNIDTDRELFLFNSDLQSVSQFETIKGLRSVMEDDERIVALRTNVRKAAESQLENGIIDATALLTKISDENVAEITAKLHEIQLIQEIYKLKYTLNR